MTSALAIDLAAPCWLWQKSIDRKGYGRLQRGGFVEAHRYIWTLMRGPIPESLVIDHLCRVRHCVNPQHMEIVTWRENAIRGDGWAGIHARKTHCPQGHSYDTANTYFQPSGGRKCRKCQCAATQRYKAKKKVAA